MYYQTQAIPGFGGVIRYFSLSKAVYYRIVLKRVGVWTSLSLSLSAVCVKLLALLAPSVTISGALA